MSLFYNSIGRDKLVLIQPSPNEVRGRDTTEGQLKTTIKRAGTQTALSYGRRSFALFQCISYITYSSNNKTVGYELERTCNKASMHYVKTLHSTCQETARNPQQNCHDSH
jgi:hypothetical protein